VDLRLADRAEGQSCAAGESLSDGANLLWREVRKAIAVESWARSHGVFGYDVFQYERQLQDGDRIESERGRHLRDLKAHPARSRPAAELRSQGFARTTPRGEILYAPDGDVLLSPEFGAGYCFRIQRERSGERRIGLVFEPSSGGDKVDIRGIIWVDHGTAELRSLEFTYTGLSRAAASPPGGGLEFKRLQDGLWIVSRWWVRTPLPRDAGVGHREEGIEVVRVSYMDGSAEDVIGRANLLGLVRDTQQIPVEGARVRLLGTDYEATTNADGRFLIPDLPTGRYRLGVARPGEPDLLNTVQDVWLSGSQSTDIELRMAQATEMRSETPAFTAADSVRWALRAVGLRTTSRVDSLIHASLAGQDDEPGRLVGRIVDRGTGRGIQGADITLLGTTHTAISSPDGRFVVGDLPPGQYMLQSRMLGYETRRDSLTIPPGLVIDAEVSLATSPIELQPIAVNVHSRWLDSNGFFERRQSGLAGTFLTRREIERKKPAVFTDLLRDIPGLSMQTDEVGKMAVRFRRVTTIFGPEAAEEGLRGCTPGVFYDGVPLNTGFDRLHNIPIPFVDGVEVYVGAATPIEYKHPCGVILIWTRRPR
jgi:hypothetical protein